MDKGKESMKTQLAAVQDELSTIKQHYNKVISFLKIKQWFNSMPA
jgi:hypothetical protein